MPHTLDHSISQSVQIIEPMPLHSTTVLYHSNLSLCCRSALYYIYLPLIFPFTEPSPTMNFDSPEIQIMIYIFISGAKVWCDTQEE